MKRKKHPPTLRDQLIALAQFAPIFSAPDFRFAAAEQGGEPATLLSDEALAFVDCMHDSGWIKSFDWASWAETPEARSLAADPEALSAATHDQLAKLLTLLIRQDRFGGDALSSAFESGLLIAIVRRAEALLTDESAL